MIALFTIYNILCITIYFGFIFERKLTFHDVVAVTFASIVVPIILAFLFGCKLRNWYENSN